MQIAKNYFEKSGIKTVITDIVELKFKNGVLLSNGTAIDIVYNRSTDFSLQSVVVAPNPLHHALYANKRNFIDFIDDESLKQYGLAANHRRTLQDHVPATTLLTNNNAVEIQKRRKQLFFKPVGGYGSKAVYRGDKLTGRVWQEILDDVAEGSEYIAQEIVPPSLRAVETVGERIRLKFDVRIYTVGGIPIVSAARVYQGQTTNFRTAGGGFAPVYSWNNEASREEKVE